MKEPKKADVIEELDDLWRLLTERIEELAGVKGRYMERHVFIFYRDKVQFIQNYFR